MTMKIEACLRLDENKKRRDASASLVRVSYWMPERVEEVNDDLLRQAINDTDLGQDADRAVRPITIYMSENMNPITTWTSCLKCFTNAAHNFTSQKIQGEQELLLCTSLWCRRKNWVMTGKWQWPWEKLRHDTVGIKFSGMREKIQTNWHSA